ncbi:hypothetical protein HZC53_00865 [Candidatus Uhrbacteria bacterium]|nr:hypothetical protein [Candidatus Uhrbacteria bacterium]
MGYKFVSPNSQFRGYGAEACLRFDDRKDLEPEELDGILSSAHENGAIIWDDAVGNETAYVVELPGRPQETYTKDALVRSLKQYLLATG